jgi:hypothetical protein|tara:strand:+ start:579 stop:779 length:201 start_codon:yes stop_codon:yes gene_type:complete
MELQVSLFFISEYLINKNGIHCYRKLEKIKYHHPVLSLLFCKDEINWSGTNEKRIELKKSVLYKTG